MLPNIQLAFFYTIAAERSRTKHTFPITIEVNHEFVMKLKMIQVKSYWNWMTKNNKEEKNVASIWLTKILSRDFV